MLPIPQIADGGFFPIDLSEPNIRWIGRNLLNRHERFIGVKSGSLSIESGKLVGGGFIIDLSAIT